jgi:Uroporphyrinogen decarboxylase (URO-D)
MDEASKKLMREEKRAQRFAKVLSPAGAEFINPAAEKAYKVRAQRVIDAIQLKEPDKVPVFDFGTYFPAYNAGFDAQTVIYDYEKRVQAWKKYVRDFDYDIYFGPGLLFPGTVLGLLDFKLYKWPGHGVGSNVPSHQYCEGEYMMENEYDALINDPSDFWLRHHMPRIFGALEPFSHLIPFTTVYQIPLGTFIPFGVPPVQAALKAMMDAGNENLKMMHYNELCDKDALSLGYPSFVGGVSGAPFDIIGDTLRGTQGIMLDLYRRPEKLLEAMERLVPILIGNALAFANLTGRPIIMMPLHKGADGFMSDKQFKTFYWPTLKKVILGMVDEGLVPLLFAEGGYNTRLEYLQELPKGSTIWLFDKTDMAKAKEVLGDTVCISGNVPSMLLMQGTVDDVKKYCRNLIEVCGKGGGYMLAAGAIVDQAKPENMQAVIAACREYGMYKR